MRKASSIRKVSVPIVRDLDTNGPIEPVSVAYAPGGAIRRSRQWLVVIGVRAFAILFISLGCIALLSYKAQFVWVEGAFGIQFIDGSLEVGFGRGTGIFVDSGTALLTKGIARSPWASNYF